MPIIWVCLPNKPSYSVNESSTSLMDDPRSSGGMIMKSTCSSSPGPNSSTLSMPVAASKLVVPLLPVFLMLTVGCASAVISLAPSARLPSALGMPSATFKAILRFCIKSLAEGFSNRKLIRVLCFCMDTFWAKPKSLNALPIRSGWLAVLLNWDIKLRLNSFSPFTVLPANSPVYLVFIRLISPLSSSR